MRRRDLIAGLAGAAVLRPYRALPQRQAIAVVGVLVPGNPDASEVLRVFRDELRKLGYVEGQNIRVEIRSAEGNIDRLPPLAAKLVAEQVSVIATWQTPATLAAKRATSEIPIVMLAAANPVGSAQAATSPALALRSPSLPARTWKS
jgi:putative ABC transport system substrate-binding protein